MTLPPRSNDALPEGTIRLSEGYEAYYRASVPNWESLARAYATAIVEPTSAEEKEPTSVEDEEPTSVEGAAKALDDSHKMAEMEFRNYLASDGPTALIRDPDTGKTLELDRKQWTPYRNFGVSGFDEDFVDPNDLVQPGPNTVLRGALRPVFFDRDEFEAFLKGLPPSRIVATANRESECKSWLIDLMTANANRPRPKRELEKEAKRRFCVGTWQFRRAWANAIDTTGRSGWRKAGRPRNRNAEIRTPK
jgi:hypothetical protein